MRKPWSERSGQRARPARRAATGAVERHEAAPAAADAHLRLVEVTKYFPANPRPALRMVSLEMRRGEILALLGESGSGKTTLLRMVAGFEQPTSGSIELAGALVSSPHHTTPPEERGVGMVFQDTALLPHLTILQNVAFGLRKLPERSRRKRAEWALALVHITGVRDRYPHEVSGGQAQRAAIGRALAPRPALLLFDEPFNNLDPVLKEDLLHELRAALRDTATTALFVTHDRDEAFTVSDAIALLHRGRIVQVGDAETLYIAPANAFVARYLGAVNLVPVWRHEATWMSALGEVAGAVPFRYAGVDTVSVRPWQLHISPVDDESNHRRGGGARGAVCGHRFMGEYHEVRVQLEDTPGVRPLTVHVPVARRFRSGDRVAVALTPPATAV